MATISLEKLVEKGAIRNLYRSPKMYAEGDYFIASDIDRWQKEEGSDFLDHLYAFPFSSYDSQIVEEVCAFLDETVGKGYRDILNEPGKHNSNIGFYNSKTNSVLGLGVGRKNRVFVLCTDKEIGNSNISDFSSLDYGGVVETIYELLQSAAINHEQMCEAINEEDEDGEFEYMKLMRDDFGKVHLAIPNLKSEFGEISPSDF